MQTVHMTKKDEKWLDPKHVPITFEAFHAIYLYFVAVGKGDLDPMLDFMIDGKYDEDFVKHVDPQFGAFGDDELFLF